MLETFKDIEVEILKDLSELVQDKSKMEAYQRDLVNLVNSTCNKVINCKHKYEKQITATIEFLGKKDIIETRECLHCGFTMMKLANHKNAKWEAVS